MPGPKNNRPAPHHRPAAHAPERYVPLDAPPLRTPAQTRLVSTHRPGNSAAPVQEELSAAVNIVPLTAAGKVTPPAMRTGGAAPEPPPPLPPGALAPVGRATMVLPVRVSSPRRSGPADGISRPAGPDVPRRS